MENFSGQNKKTLRTTYPKNHENFKNSKSKVQFTGSYKKKECIEQTQYKQYKNLNKKMIVIMTPAKFFLLVLQFVAH